MRDRLGLSEGDVALLYAAEFSGRKSQHTLLEALPGLPGKREAPAARQRRPAG